VGVNVEFGSRLEIPCVLQSVLGFGFEKVEIMASEELFFQQNYKYYQACDHWLDKAAKLRRAFLFLYDVNLPDLQLYDAAYNRALMEIGEEGSAPIRYQHPDMLPAFGLFGSAIENLFKAIMIHNDPNLIGADRLSSDVKCHDLLQLAKKAEIALTNQEVRLLEWLTEVVIWKARYSVPTNLKFGDKFFHPLDNASLADAEASKYALEGLFTRINNQLPQPQEKPTDDFDVLVVWKE
jgi:hypothetical protein